MESNTLNAYSVCFSRPFESATIHLRATCIEEAMQNAQLIAKQRFRWLRFQTDIPRQFRAITQIDVRHEDSGETRRWLAEHLRFTFATDTLLHAARNVLANWEKGDLAEAVRNLDAAIECAEGRIKGGQP
jgi:hypothetical protein